MVTAAIQILNKGHHLTLHDEGRLAKSSFTDHLFRASHTAQVQKITDFIKKNLLTASSKQQAEYVHLADALILRYKNDQAIIKSIRLFDRFIAPYRNKLDYLEPVNKINFTKWQRAGQPIQVFRDFPKFASFLESSYLLSQLKVTRDRIRLIHGKPALKVNRVWLSASSLLKRFEIVKSKQYDSTFVIDKTSKEVYTYLDNGKGLQKHHPFLSTNTPLSILSREDYATTHKKALSFIRANERSLSAKERAQRNRKRTFILQYVSSHTPRGTSNLSALLRNPRHPFIRLIIGKDNPELHTKKREVYEAGYGWKHASRLPGLTQHGRFRSPDPWEYMRSIKTVTNIPITQKEAHQFYRFSMKYHKDGVELGKEPSFNLFHHNCSVYAKEASKAAGLFIPTEIPITEAMTRILPEWILAIGRTVQSATTSTAAWFRKERKRIIPQTIGNALRSIETGFNALVYKITDVAFATAIIPIRAFLGGAFGPNGAAFRQLNEPQEEIGPPLRNWSTWFSLSKLTVHLPGIAQEWQLKQPSTVVYPEDHIKLTIVPPCT